MYLPAQSFHSLFICICLTKLMGLILATADIRDIPSVFPGRLKAPGVNDPYKLWWAKEITPDLYVCGRLSERQIKYAADAGFKSILSLFTYPTGDPGGSFGGDYLPITDEENVIVQNTDNLQFVNLLEPMDEWASIEAIEKFTAIVPTLKKPSLLRCDRGYTITFVALLYLANQTKYVPDFEPKIYVQDFFSITASMGLDFDFRIPLEVIEEVIGRPVEKGDKFLPKPVFQPEDWLDYWFAHAVYFNWFIAGQIMKSHLAPIEEFGYKSVINLRLGLTHNGKPSQEEVNLINILPQTGTYKDGHTLPRQKKERLEQTRIDPSRPPSFVCNTSSLNYESQNEHEFGDEIGYNEELERQAFEKSGLNYYHMPLAPAASLTDLETFFGHHMERLMEIGRKGPVLVHCSSGTRAAYVSVLAAAYQHDLSLDWALQRLKEMGFAISQKSHPDIYSVYNQWLSKVRVEL